MNIDGWDGIISYIRREWEDIMQKNRGKLYQKIMTPAVVAALITGVISIIVSFGTNQKLEEIEEQKYTYDLQERRYGKLQEFLNFFSGFKVFSTEYLYNFDLNNGEYSVNSANKTMHDSIDDFSLQLNLLVPYLSDEAIDLLKSGGVLDENGMESYDVQDDIYNKSPETEVSNEVIKKNMEQINAYFDHVSQYIVKAITNDIRKEYVPG